MATIQQLQTWLTQAEEALHNLTLGAQKVSFERSGTKIVYTPAQIPALKSYIASLNSQIRAKGGSPDGSNTARRGILYNVF